MFYPLQIHELRRETRIPAPPEEVFSFFSDAANLDRLTPAWLGFRILTPPPIVMRRGALIEYSLKLYGVRFRWETEIKAWEPCRRFVDEQIRGPYLYWSHEHLFTPEGEGTRMADHVKYAVPGFVFEPLIHPLFIKGRLERIFEHRGRTIQHIFGPGPAGEQRP